MKKNKKKEFVAVVFGRYDGLNPMRVRAFTVLAWNLKHAEELARRRKRHSEQFHAVERA